MTVVAPVMTSMMAAMMATVTTSIHGTAIGRTTVAEVLTVWIDAGASSRERTTEAGGSALEIREAAWRAIPVARSRTILRRREGREDLGGSIQDTAGRRWDFDGFLVESATVHAEWLCSLSRFEH
jgi:hypothetical protein